MVKVQVKHLTKVFGKKHQAALSMVQEQRPKNEILEKQGQRLGCMTPISKSTKVKSSSLWDFRKWKINSDTSD